VEAASTSISNKLGCVPDCSFMVVDEYVTPNEALKRALGCAAAIDDVCKNERRVD
jgi:hypothetical protein